MTSEEELDEQGGMPDFLRDPLGIPGRHRLAMVLSAALGLIGTAVATAMWTPTYTATATLLVARQKIPEDLVKTTVEEDPFTQLNRMVGETLTRARLSTIVTEQKLYRNRIDKEPMSTIVARMREAISLNAADQYRAPRGQVPTSQIYRLEFEYGEADVAADVANSLAALFLEAGIKGRMDKAGEISQFLQQELVAAERELKEQDAKISEFKQRYRGELPSELGANISRLQRLQDQRQSLALQFAESETRIATMAATSSDPGSPRARLALMQAKLDAELAVNTAEHPNVIATQRQVDALERLVANSAGSAAGDSIEAVIAGSRLSLARQREELTRTEAELEDLDARVARTPKRQEELDALDRVANVKRERYLDMMRKVEGADLAEQLETSKYGANISILDRAHPPSTPKRTRLVVALAGLVGTIGLAIGAGLFFELLDPVLVDGEQAQRLAEVPVLGSIPRIS